MIFILKGNLRKLLLGEGEGEEKEEEEKEEKKESVRTERGKRRRRRRRRRLSCRIGAKKKKEGSVRCRHALTRERDREGINKGRRSKRVW